jgi:hypothetical protein
MMQGKKAQMLRKSEKVLAELLIGSRIRLTVIPALSRNLSINSSRNL